MANKTIQVEEVTINGKQRFRKIIPGGGRPFIKEEEYKKLKKEFATEKYKREQEQFKIDEAEYKRIESKTTEEARERLAKSKKRKAELLEPKVDLNLQKVTKFLSRIDIEGDTIGEKNNIILEKYSSLIKEKITKVLARKFLRLSNKYDNLNNAFAKLFKEVTTKKIVTDANDKTFQDLVGKIDTFEKEFDALVIEENSLLRAIDEKEEKQAKENQERDKKNGSSDKEKRRSTIQARWDERKEDRIQRAQQEEKQKKLRTRKRLDDFFGGKIPIVNEGKIAGKVLGSFLAAPFKASGFTFDEERRFLGTLFSPAAALGKAGFKGIKSLTESAFGVSDKQLDGVDEFGEESFSNKKQRKPLDKNKLDNILNSVKKEQNDNSISTKNVNQNSSNIINNKNIKNDVSENRQKNTTFQNNKSDSKTFLNGGASEGLDLNRSDDKDNIKPTEKSNELLEKILKELKKEESDNKKEKKSLFGGKGAGILGLIGKLGLPVAVGGGLAALLYGLLSKDDPKDKESSSSSPSSPNSKKIFKNPFPGIKKRFKDGRKKTLYEKLLKSGFESGKADELSTNYYEDRSKLSNSEISSIQKVFYETSNEDSPGAFSGFMNGDGNQHIDTPDPMNTKDSTSFKKDNKVIMTPDINKIEKIKDTKQNPSELEEKMEKFLLEVFGPKLADDLANSLNSKKGSGKSVMPSIDPF